MLPQDETDSNIIRNDKLLSSHFHKFNPECHDHRLCSPWISLHDVAHVCSTSTLLANVLHRNFSNISNLTSYQVPWVEADLNRH